MRQGRFRQKSGSVHVMSLDTWRLQSSYVIVRTYNSIWWCPVTVCMQSKSILSNLRAKSVHHSQTSVWNVNWNSRISKHKKPSSFDSHLVLVTVVTERLCPLLHKAHSNVLHRCQWIRGFAFHLRLDDSTFVFDSPLLWRAQVVATTPGQA